ncbi:MAG TPA: FeoB small GTPase domain-containing protein, partial [Spirochaetota bacterium]|nr:FeoB small GTPase domain-containing protein [Spirochaetota bacterium]
MKNNKIIRVGLAGNPNSGKTTIFNAITGARQKVGNYAGVTVEKKEGEKNYNGVNFKIYDLPGVYSLTAYSLDEVVARDFIIDEKPDIIIDVIDSTNIERNLYLLLQFQELGIPVVCALNITDQAESRGIKIDEKNLSKILGIPMIKTIGIKGIGIDEVLDKVIELYESDKKPENKISYGM